MWDFLSQNFTRNYCQQINYLRKIKLAFLLLTSLFLSEAAAQVQEVTFNRVLPPQGFLFGMINGISQDSYGYLWIVTYGRGLYRYDGYHFVAYSNDPKNPSSLAENELQAICVDHNGMIWVGTSSSGLDRLDPTTGIFVHYRHIEGNIESLSDDRITEILEDRKGQIWVGTANGLNQLNTRGTFTRFLHNEGDRESLSCNEVQVIYEDHKGVVWVGTGTPLRSYSPREAGGLNRYNPATRNFTTFLHDPKDSGSLTDNRVGAVFEDSRGVFWVTTARDGLHIMNRENGSFRRYFYDPHHPDSLSPTPQKNGVPLDLNLYFINEDRSGAVWMGLSDGSMTRYDPSTKTSRHYNSFNGDIQAMRAVSGAYASRDGVLWITTWGGNIYKIDPAVSNIPHFSTGSIVHAVQEDPWGDLWLGTYGEGVTFLDRKTGITKRIFLGPADTENWVPAIYEEEDSTMWFGTVNKLVHYNRKTKKFTRYVHNPKDETSLSKGSIVAIIADNSGSLWLATNNGLDHLQINTGVFKHFRNIPADSNSLSDNYASALLKDHAGNLWVGSWSGNVLNKLDPATGKFRQFSCGTNIGSIMEDHEHVIWVGTANGLYRSNTSKDSFSRFTDPRIEMTSSTIVTGILEDNQQNLWVASSLGIFKINRDRNQISLYNQHQGVDPTNLTFPLMRCSKGRRNEFFFGDLSGYYAFFPELYKSNVIPPQIVINSFNLGDQPVKAGDGSPLSMPVMQSEEIRLNYQQNTFSFDFAGIHYSSPEDNQHLFLLEDLDDNWRKAGSEKKAYYYTVPPGRYVFRVKASNRDGVWAEKAITVIISPPWYRTWWFYLFFTVMLLLSLAIFIKLRERTLKNEKELLEKKVAARTNELWEEKERAESALSELRATQSQLIESEKATAEGKLQQAMLNERLRISRELHDDIGSTLSGIVLYTHMAESQLQAYETNEVKNALRIIKQSANNMVNRLNDLVWAVNPGHNSLQSLMQKLEDYAMEMAKVKNIKVRMTAPPNLDELQLPLESRHNIYLLAKEAINNAVKYSHASLLDLSVQQLDHELIFTIMDNGKGFDMAAVRKGNGLINMRRRADEASAKLHISSTAQIGTLISLHYKIT